MRTRERRARLRPPARDRRRRWSLPVRLGSATARLFVLLLFGLAAICAALGLSLRYIAPVQSGHEIPLSQFYALAGSNRLQSAVFYDFDHRILGRYSPPAAAGAGAPPPVDFWTGYPSTDAVTPLLIGRLVDSHAPFSIVRQSDKSVVQFLAQYVLPLLMLADVFGLVLLAVRGGDSLGGLIRFGRIGRRGGRGTSSGVTFADVGGAEEALAELREVRDYLRDPERFASVGARPPKGLLLFGAPGCGKTLMARAIAGEADVPFFSISGAEFVESLVGIGAARVRDLFRQVREVAPAIVFIDELDAAGRRRSGVTGGQEEREQTLNQLLVEMDGFDAAEGIVVIGATNRPDILDPALLRPGRFDRQVTVEPPDIDGRREILELHARQRPLAPDVDLRAVAERTPGFTGADLANVVNEAALLTVRGGKADIGRPELDEAVMRVTSGPQRRGHLLTPEERHRVALHESGHAVVAAALGRLPALHRLSIMAREHSLGQTAFSRQMKERALLTEGELLDELVIAMAGVAAEEEVLGEPSTGSRADLVRATELAQMMVGVYGMSDELGKVSLLRTEGAGFLGEEMVPTELAGGRVLETLHAEVRRLAATADLEARAILRNNGPALTTLAGRLAAEETLHASELQAVLAAVVAGPARVMVPRQVALDGHAGSLPVG